MSSAKHEETVWLDTSIQVDADPGGRDRDAVASIKKVLYGGIEHCEIDHESKKSHPPPFQQFLLVIELNNTNTIGPSPPFQQFPEK